MWHNCLGHKVAQFWPKLGPKRTIVLNGKFCGKLTKVTFISLLCSIMLKCFKRKNNSDRSWDIRLNNFGPNWTQIVLLLKKGTFWENWLILLLSTNCAPICYDVSKKILRVWQIMRYIRCWSFEPNWTQITQLSLKEIFLKNWLMLILSTLCT